VVEDPATGAAAAALGGYLRHHRLVDVPADIVVRQGDDMGRPSTIEIHVSADGGIDIVGTAVTIEGPPG
jgi:PhzF family phenazine biosynthesis protein